MNGRQHYIMILGIVLVALVWPVVALAQGPDLDRVNQLLRTTNFLDGLRGGWKSGDKSGGSEYECGSGYRCYEVMGPGGTKYSVVLPDHVQEGPPGAACLYCTQKSCREENCDTCEFCYDVGFDRKRIRPVFGSPCTEPDDEYFQATDNWFADKGYADEGFESSGGGQPGAGQVLGGMDVRWAHDLGQGRYVPVSVSTGGVGVEIRLCSDPLADPDETERHILMLAELVENKLDGIALGGAAGWSEVPPGVRIFFSLLGPSGAVAFAWLTGLFPPHAAGGAVQPQPGLQPRPQPMPQPQPRPQPQPQPEQLRAQQQERVKKVLDKLDNQANQCYASAQPIRAGLEARLQAGRDQIANIQKQQDQRGGWESEKRKRLKEEHQLALDRAERARSDAFERMWKEYDLTAEKLRDQYGNWVSDITATIRQWRTRTSFSSAEALPGIKEIFGNKWERILKDEEGKLQDLKDRSYGAKDPAERDWLQRGIDEQKQQVFGLQRRLSDIPKICDKLWQKGPERTMTIRQQYKPEEAPAVVQALERLAEHDASGQEIDPLAIAEKEAKKALRDLEKLYDDNVGGLNDRKADYDQARQALQQFVQQASPLDPGFNSAVQELRQKATSAARRVCEASSYMGAEVERSPAYLQGPVMLDEDGEPLEYWTPDSAPGDDGYPGTKGDVWYDGRWMDPADAEQYVNQELANDEWFEEQKRKFASDCQKSGEDWFRDELREMEQDLKDMRDLKKREEAAYHHWESLWKYGEKYGEDEFLNRLGENAWNPDGSINVDYVDKARRILKDRIHRETAPADSGPDSPYGDAFKNTLWDFINHPGTRLIAGGLSGGSSELFYQPLSAYDAMYREAAKAADEGRDVGFWYNFAVGLKAFGAENLPVNTVMTLQDPNWNIKDLATSLVFDGLATADAVDTFFKAGSQLSYATGMDKLPGTKIDASGHLGVSEFDKNGLEGVAKKHGVNIEVRQTNPHAASFPDHPKKPCDLKCKTIDEWDSYLGASKDDMGKVGYFDPQLPEGVKVDDLPPEAQKRYRQRKNEFRNRGREMEDMIANGDIAVKDGVVVNTGLDGDPGMQGKPFVGDIDIKSITDAETGKPVTGARYEAVINDAAPYGVQHGANDNWQPTTPYDKGVKSTIEHKHTPNWMEGGGEALGNVGPDGQWTATYHQPVKFPKVPEGAEGWRGLRDALVTPGQDEQMLPPG